jgi:cytidine diphosphoramidate kinase
MIVWVIGLAGAGKTTIGQALYNQLKAQNPKTVFLDGDHIRQIFGNDLSHTIEDRRKNGERICQLCNFFDNEGIDAVCAVLSLFPDQQAWNRKNFSSYFEIFVDTSWKTLLRRDQKGLYSDAQSGQIQNVVGVDIPFEPPPNPDMIIEGDSDQESLDVTINTILQQLQTIN